MTSLTRRLALLVLVAAAAVPVAAGWPRLMLVPKDGGLVAIDATGHEVRLPKGVDPIGYSEGLFVATNGSRVGFVDTSGRVAIGFRFDWAEPFDDGLAPVEVRRRGREWGRSGFVDRAGRFVVPAIYEAVLPFSEGRAVVITRSNYAFIDRKGRIVIRGPFDLAESFSEGLAPVMRNYSWGYVDRSGRLAIPYRFRAAGRFSDGLAPVVTRMSDAIPFGVPMTGAGFIDGSGRMVIEPKYSTAEPFSDGLALVTEGNAYRPSPNHVGREVVVGRMVFIDRTGRAVLELGKDVMAVRSFREGFAYVEYADKTRGFLDRTGKRVIVLAADAVRASDFDGGLARVWLADGRMGVIDRTGAYVWTPKR